MGWPISPPGRLAFTEHPTCAPTGWKGATYQPVWPGGGGKPEDSTRQSCDASFFSLLLLTGGPCRLLINKFLAHTTQSCPKFKTPSSPASRPRVAHQSFSDAFQGQMDTGVSSFWTPILSQYIWPVFGLVGNSGSEVPSSTEAPESVSHSFPILLSLPSPDLDGPSDTKQCTLINRHTLSQRQIEETGRICCFFWNRSCRSISSIHHHV